MEQLWYTSCRNGLGSGSGYTVRAASASLKDLRTERYTRLSRYLRYSLPVGANPNTTQPHQAPRTLALLNTGKERILLHQVYVGPDYTGMRYGNHFTHLVTDVPESFTAREATSLWRSEFWAEREDRLPPGVYDLPLVELDDMKPGVLSRGHLDTAELRRWLEFIIRAYLVVLPTAGTLYNVAPSDIVAALIWGMTRCLPIQLLADLTFTTYTHEIGTVSARIIGTGGLASSTFSPTAMPDLPPASYGGQNLALNCYTGTESQLGTSPLIEGYARFAVEGLLGSDPNFALLLQAAETRFAITITEFLNLYRLVAAGTAKDGPSFSDLTTILADRGLAARLLSCVPVQEALLRACRADPESEAGKWWREKLKPALDRLWQYSGAVPRLLEALAMLQGPAISACQLALVAGDLSGTQRLFDQMLISVSGGDLRQRLDALCRGLHPNQVTSLAARIWLVERAAAGRGSNETWTDFDTRMAEWLHMPWQELGALLARKTLPPSWREYAAFSAIQRHEPHSQDATALIDEHTDAFVPALSSLAHDPDTFPSAKRLFLAVVEDRGRSKLRLLSALLESVPEHREASRIRAGLLQAAGLTAQEVRRVIDDHPDLADNADTVRALVERCLDPAMEDPWLAWNALLQHPRLAAELLKRERRNVRELLVDCAANEPDTWRWYLSPALAQLREESEPAELKLALEGLVVAARRRAVTALLSGRLKEGGDLFDRLIALASPQGEAEELVALAGELTQNFDSQSDADEAWQLREWVLQRAYKHHLGATHPEQDHIDRMVRPWLAASDTGLPRLNSLIYRLAAGQFASGRGRSWSSEPTLPSFLQEWLNLAQESIPRHPPTSLVPESPMDSQDRPSAAPTGGTMAPTSSAPSHGPEQNERIETEGTKVAQGIEQDVDRFKKTIRLPEKRAEALSDFEAICRSAPERRVELLESAHRSVPSDEHAYLDRLVAASSLVDEKLRPDMRAIEKLLLGSFQWGSNPYVPFLRYRPESEKVFESYLRALDLNTCQLPHVLFVLQEIAERSDWQNDTRLNGIRMLASAWLEVAALARANTAQHIQADVLVSSILRIAEKSSSGAEAVGPVLYLLATKLRQPQHLADFMKALASRKLEVARGQQIADPESAFRYFLEIGRDSTPKREAERLLPYARITCEASGDSGLSGQPVRMCRTYLLDHLKRSDSATVVELSRLIEQLANEKKSPYLKDEWHTFLERLPPELRPAKGIKKLLQRL